MTTRWTPPSGDPWGMPLSRDGWQLSHRTVADSRQWYVTSPDGTETAFATDGGLHLAIDMADALIDGRSTS